MDRKEYRLLLKDPRWKAKRLEILERDNHTCSVCGCEDNLQVHHRVYEDIAPWEYNNSDLVTMCDDCHEKQHQDNGNSYRSYYKQFNVVSEYASEDYNETFKTNSNVEITTSKKILLEIIKNREEKDNLIFNSIDTLISDINDFTDLQNSGRLKINAKVCGDFEATIYINIFYKKKDIAIKKIQQEKKLTKKELAKKVSDEYFAALKVKKKAYADKIKAEKEMKAALKVSSDIQPQNI